MNVGPQRINSDSLGGVEVITAGWWLACGQAPLGGGGEVEGGEIDECLRILNIHA